MNKTYHLHTSQLRAAIDQLQAGDRVLLTGTIYTARDAAHKRLFTLLDEGKALPFPLKDAVIYYAGPTPVSCTGMTRCISALAWKETQWQG